MADEGDLQLSRPGVLEGKVKPDYNKVIEMASVQALRTDACAVGVGHHHSHIGGFILV